jgi:uncharacterized 2Fe-2S/4Fe-4S cluster protein (DUF4445 family)
MKLRLTSGEVVPCRPGETVFSALKRAGIFLVAPCGSKGTCGKCRIGILEGRFSTDGYATLTKKERVSGLVLSCMTRPDSDLMIHIPKESLLVIGDRIAVAGKNNPAKYLQSYGVEINPVRTKNCYGIAIDIGTTTVVVYLVNLASGEVTDVGSTYNSQIRFGDDVITRIIHATEGGGLRELKEAVVSDINTIVNTIAERHDICPADIVSAVISGNTVMSHIFWGLDTSSIREEPYAPLMTGFPLKNAFDAGLLIYAEAPVYTAPCIASYVGGDIVTGVLASKMHRSDGIALFMDIGTNGEIVIGNREWLLTAACSAGPCFEGSGIRCGMRATPGAIESISIESSSSDPVITVIGGGTPLGICGSGMIDAISEMFLQGIIDQKGKFAPDRSSRIRAWEDGLEYVICRDTARAGQDIVLTEIDIENIMRSKAAMYAGIATLLSGAGLSMADIEKVYIAGGFGNCLDVRKAIILGMLPDMPADRFAFLGNTSITGAYLCLMSDSLRSEAEDIASKMTYIELSTSGMFMEEYISALFLPHTDMKLFPSVPPAP